MLFPDSGIFSPKIDSAENLVFTVKIKKQDYNETTTKFIFDCYNSGKTVDFEVVGLGEKDNEIPRLIQRLVLVMNEYSQKTKTPIESLKNSLYLRYKVTSRKELSREQLEEAIRFYFDGLTYE